jgi:uncharacterized iron-regulated membrane protein
MAKPSFSWRKSFQTLHLWLGLASGILVVILCLTGTVLGLRGPVEAWVNRDVLHVQAQGQRQALETLIPRVVADTGKPFTGVVVMPGETEALQFLHGRQVTYVNPYTGEVLGGFNPAVSEAFMVVFRLHRWLLLDTPIGRPITGAATVIFLFILMTGLLLWWPKRWSQLQRALTLRNKTNWLGLNYDLHVVLGFYALVPLLVMGASGLYWSYSPEFKHATYMLLDGKPAPASALAARPPANDKGKPFTALPYTQLLAKTHATYPYAGPVTIAFPKSPEKPVVVTKIHSPTAISLPYTDRLQLDARTAEVLKQDPFAEKSRAEKLLSLIKHIHLGTVYGGLSLTLYVLACAIGTSLPITGFLYWLGKRNARRPRTPRAPQPLETVATTLK